MMENSLLQSHINQQVKPEIISLHLLVRFGDASVALCLSLLMKPPSYKLPLLWSRRFLGSFGRVIVTVLRLSKIPTDRQTFIGEVGRSHLSTSFFAQPMSLTLNASR